MSNFNLPPDVSFEDLKPVDDLTLETKPKQENKSGFDMRNYLDFSIPEGQTSREITIRLLPISHKTPTKYFQIVHIHNIKVNSDLKPNKSGRKGYICLNKSDLQAKSKCPICEIQDNLWQQWHAETEKAKKDEIVNQIKDLNTRKYCIVRCIERSNEKDGPKFWRIPIRNDKTDVYHKILLLAETRNKEGKEAGVDVNILSLHNGRDLKITFTEGTGAPTVVDKGISTPLSSNEEEFNNWFYNEKKWDEVFTVKPYEYLQLAFNGETPWFDKISQKWVSKAEFDRIKNSQTYPPENESKNIEIKQSVNEIPFTQSTQPTTNTPLYDDELPF